MRPRVYSARKRRPHVSVRADVYAKLQAAAKAAGDTPTGLVERLVNEWLDAEEAAS